MRSTDHLFWLCALAAGCYGGELTDSADTIADRDLSGIAGPPDRGSVRPAEVIGRDLFGMANGPQALTFGSLGDAPRAALFDARDPDSPLAFFVTPHTAEDGVGPMFNQNRCGGCHENARDNAVVAESSAVGDVLLVNSPVARAGRRAVTDHDLVNTPLQSPSGAFTLFGDYFVADRRFDPLALFGGPVRHTGATGACFVDRLPDEAADPNLASGAVRQVGERAAPSYVGRGLIEAIYAPDIEALSDPEDRVSSLSTLVPSPSCAGDCISGRANQNRADAAIVGGDPIVRLGRFGLRAAAPSLLEVVAAGAQRDLGYTHPFSPTEEQNPYNAGLICDVAPDPELGADEVLALREMIRALAPPELAPALLVAEPDDAASTAVHAGAQLFGVDLEALRTRVVTGEEPTGFGDEDADRAISVDRQLNCVGCHTPIVVTGQSPSTTVGEQLSNRWVPLFSDLLIHDMGSLPLEGDLDAIFDSHPFFNGVRRNLADFVLPNQGVATGAEWRTAPLLAFGLVGPPFLHDARVFLNPIAPAYFYYGSRTADEAALSLEARRVEIVDVDTAIRAAIELHDLPQPPDLDLDGTPDYASCPPLPSALDWCRRDSPFRSEAKNVVEKWHALGDAEQAQVVAFLKAL